MTTAWQAYFGNKMFKNLFNNFKICTTRSLHRLKFLYIMTILINFSTPSPVDRPQWPLLHRLTLQSIISKQPLANGLTTLTTAPQADFGNENFKNLFNNVKILNNPLSTQLKLLYIMTILINFSTPSPVDRPQWPLLHRFTSQSKISKEALPSGLTTITTGLLWKWNFLKFIQQWIFYCTQSTQ